MRRAQGGVQTRFPFTYTAPNADEGQFQNSLRADMTAPPLLFVHGFNTGFEDAVGRALDLAEQCHCEGTIVLFTWPSGDAIYHYHLVLPELQQTISPLSGVIVQMFQVYKVRSLSSQRYWILVLYKHGGISFGSALPITYLLIAPLWPHSYLVSHVA